jgi:hypothetical protein
MDQRLEGWSEQTKELAYKWDTVLIFLRELWSTFCMPGLAMSLILVQSLRNQSCSL